MRTWLWSIKYFNYGRHLLSATMVLGFSFVACLLLWDMNVPTHLLGQFDARWIASLEAIPTVAGCVALSFVAPVAADLEAFGTMRLRVASTSTALLVVFTATSMAPLSISIWGVSPRSLVPRADHYLSATENFWEVAPVWGRGASAVTTAFLLGLSLLFISLLGRGIGLLLSILSYLGLLVAQSDPNSPLGFLPGVSGRIPEVTPQAVLPAIALVAVGLSAWYLSGASASILRRLAW